MISFQHIHKQYEGYKALQDVTFSIPKGKIFGLLGPNGAGKTTLLRLLTRMLLPDTGKIFFDQEEIKEEHLSKIGYLPEERGLYPKMRADEHIYFLAALKGVKKRVAKENLLYWSSKLKVETLLNRRIENLSKGQQQKVQLMASLIHQPELLILDEPFSGFDPVNAEVLKSILLQLQSEGKTIVISTHRMDNAEELCSEIAMLHKGKLVLNQTMDEILSPYNNKRIKIIKRGTIEFSSSYDILHQSENTALLSPKKHLTTNQLVLEIADQVEIVSFEPEKKSLREVFLMKAEA